MMISTKPVAEITTKDAPTKGDLVVAPSKVKFNDLIYGLYIHLGGCNFSQLALIETVDLAEKIATLLEEDMRKGV